MEDKPKMSVQPSLSEVIVGGTSVPQLTFESKPSIEKTNTPVPQDQEMSHAENEDDVDEHVQHTLSLPISKIKRIFKMDPDYFAASQSAVYATGLATELFIQHFVEQASMFAKLEKRKKIVYKDFSNAVSGHDSLNFLSDTVPKTAPIGELIKKNAVTTDINDELTIVDEDRVDEIESVEKKKPILANGQQTLNFGNSSSLPIKKSVLQDLVSQDPAPQAGSKDVEMID